MTWIQTYTGKKFPLNNFDPAQIDIEDIAHALSNICRFTGHTNKFYSVAEHCLWASKFGYSSALKLRLLLHDAQEAYLSDISRPLKAFFPLYKSMEEKLQTLIYEKYGLPFYDVEADAFVKEVDNRLLMTEARDLMNEPPEAWALDKHIAYENLDLRTPKSPITAKFMFLEAFDQLSNDLEKQ